MLLINPPLTIPCESPPSLAYLAGALRAENFPYTLCDMNLEGVEYLFETTEAQVDTWSKRAFKNLDRNLTALRDPKTYKNRDRYKRAVADINRVLGVAGKPFDLHLSLSNYLDNTASPLRSDDLISAATNFTANIFYPYFSRRFEELISLARPKVVGFSLNYLSQTLCTFSMIGYLRTQYPELKIVVGGGLATTWLSHPHWRNQFGGLVDLFVSGRGEIPLLKYLGCNSPATEAMPYYGDLQHLKYLSPGFILPFTSSYGCFWKKCSFCPETTENSLYCMNEPEQTVADLETLCTTTSPALIHLLDNAVSPSTLKAISRHTFKAPWYGFARFDKLLANKDFCRRLRESGCVMLKLGLESGDQKVLDEMQKGINLTIASQVLRNLKEVGIGTYIYLLFGTPPEDEDGAKRTLDFVEKHHDTITFLNLAIFNLPIGSKESSALEVADFYNADLSIYQDFTHPKGWSRAKIRRFLDATFKKNPLISPILQNDPPLFSSNHAPFLLESYK
jgi:hypothetical protein